MRRTAIAAFMCVPVVFAACGEEPGATASDGVLDVSLTDFSFGDLADEIVAGTRVQIENTSETELHELVAVRLADGDDRPIDEIVASGLDEVLGAGPPAAVLLAAPGGKQIDAVGDGALDEPGRRFGAAVSRGGARVVRSSRPRRRVRGGRAGCGPSPRCGN